MKVRFTTAQVGKASYVLARMIVFALPFFLLLHLIGQPELDDRHPLFGTRSVGAKIFKQEHSSKSGWAHILQLSLAVGSRQLALVHTASAIELVHPDIVEVGNEAAATHRYEADPC